MECWIFPGVNPGINSDGTCDGRMQLGPETSILATDTRRTHRDVRLGKTSTWESVSTIIKKKPETF